MNRYYKAVDVYFIQRISQFSIIFENKVIRLINMALFLMNNTFFAPIQKNQKLSPQDYHNQAQRIDSQKKLIPSTFDTDQPNHGSFEPFKLAKIVKKFKIKAIEKSFLSKIKRNNIYSQKSEFLLKSRQQTDEQRIIKLKGFEIQNRGISSLIFFGDIVMSLFIFYISVFQAFSQGFRMAQTENPLILSLKIIALIFQCSKIFLKIITKQYYKGVRLDYITDILLYSAGLFDLFIYFSAISIIMITIVAEVTQEIGLISFVVAFIKVLKTSQNVKVLEVYYINSTRKQQYWNLIKVIIFNLFFGHLIAGFLIGMSKLDTVNNWIIRHHLENQPWHVIYSWAFYWSATMITTTGFGDYAATNQNEAIVIAGLQFTSSVVLVYNINLIGTIVMRMRETDQMIEKKLAVFRRMNDQTPINPFLQKKIHSYIQFQNNLQELFQFQDRKQLLDQIPHQLKIEYSNEVTQMIFKNLPFFRHLRTETMNTLADSIKSSVVHPTEYLIKNKVGRNYIYILRKGKIGYGYQKLQSSLNGTIVQSLQSKTQPVLLTNYFLNRTRQITFDLIAEQYSLIMKIKQSQLIDIIRQSDLDRQYFFTIYDKQQVNFIFKNEKCQFCTDQYHNKFQCPRLHFMPFKSIVMWKQIKQPYRKNRRISDFCRRYMRKEHCYYLRKDYYEPYQEMKAINHKKVQRRHSINMQFNSAFREVISDDNLSKQDFLQKCQTVFRKIFQQKFEQDSKQQSLMFRSDFEVAHNYNTYFHQCNPDKLICISLFKKNRNETKYKNHFQQLGVKSNKYIYRRYNTLKQLGRQDQKRQQSQPKKHASLSLKLFS